MNNYVQTHLKRCLLFAICIVLNSVANAQTLSLYDAVNKTINNYPLIHQREAELSASRAHVSTVNGNRLPSLTLHDQINAGTSNSLPGSYFPLGLIPSTSGSIAAANNNTLTSGNVAISYLQWDIYAFGYYNALHSEANAAVATSQAGLNSDKYLLAQNIVTLYIDWLKKYRVLQIEQDNVNRAMTILTAIRATVTSGLKPGVDSSTASAAYSDAHIAYLNAVNDFNNDKIAVAEYTTVNNALPDTSILSAGQSVSLLEAQNTGITDSVPLNHPLLDVYEKQYEQQLADNNTISRKYLPKLGIDGAAWMRGSSISSSGVYSDDLSSGLPYSRYNYLFGLTLTYNITDLRHRHDQLTEGRYQAQARQDNLQTQQTDLNKVLQQVNTQYNTTYEKLKELPVQVHSANEAYGQQLALYKAGLNTLIDVTNAQYVLRQAQTNYVIAQADLLQLLYIRAGLNGQADVFLEHYKK